MRNYCTLLDSEYLGRGQALVDSMRRWCQPFKLFVLALDQATLKALNGQPDLKVCPSTVIESPLIHQLARERTRKRFVWALKPLWIRYVMELVSAVTYVDSDSLFFSSPDPLYDEIGNNPIAITPHRFGRALSSRATDVGNFNAGFIRFGRVHPCLYRWCEQVLKFCGRKPGHCYDQIYLNEWPKLWKAHTVRHKGVNLAPWNQTGNNYVYNLRNGFVFVDEDPLVWYHFHGGTEPEYNLDPFVKTHVYGPYRQALNKAISRNPLP